MQLGRYVMGWMPNCLGSNDSIFYLNRWLTFSQEWGGGLEHATKNFTKTNMGCQKHREGRMGSWLDLVWIVHGQ